MENVNEPLPQLTRSQQDSILLEGIRKNFLFVSDLRVEGAQVQIEETLEDGSKDAKRQVHVRLGFENEERPGIILLDKGEVEALIRGLREIQRALWEIVPAPAPAPEPLPVEPTSKLNRAQDAGQDGEFDYLSPPDREHFHE